MSNRRAWLTPNEPVPDEYRGRCFSVPNDNALVGAVTGALLPLTDANNWESSGSMSPADTAELMSAAFEAFVSGDCSGEGGDCPPVELPDGQRVWRRQPSTGLYELVDTELGTWVFPDGTLVETLPLPDPRTETTDEEKLCLACANAANALFELWGALLTLWNDEVEPVAATLAWATEAGLTLGGAYYPPLAAAATLLGAGFGMLFEAFDLITSGEWDEAFSEKLKCVLYDNATLEDDDTVTFAHSAVIWNMNLQSWANPQNMLITMQLQYILSMIGEEGLNRAGGTTAITEADCTCGVWGRQWTFAQMHTGPEFALVQGLIDADQSVYRTGTWPGSFAAVSASVVVPVDTHIYRFEVNWTHPSGGSYLEVYQSGGSNSWIHSGTPLQYPSISYYPVQTPAYLTDVFHAYPVSVDGTGSAMTFTFAMRTGDIRSRLKGFRIVGDGPCPFTSGDAF